MFFGARWIVPALLMISSAAGTAFADLAKLDPRARVALSMLRDGVTIEAAKARGASIANEGTIDAFIVGPVSRHELEARRRPGPHRGSPGHLHRLHPRPAPSRRSPRSRASVGSRARPRSSSRLDLSVPSTGANLLRGAGPPSPGSTARACWSATSTPASTTTTRTSRTRAARPAWSASGTRRRGRARPRALRLRHRVVARPDRRRRVHGGRRRLTATARTSWASPAATAAAPAARSRRSPTSAWPRRPTCAW